MSGSNAETWRVVLADGAAREVEVRAFEYQGRHICWTANRHATGESKGAAVVYWARNLSLDVREIVPPGEPTRAELAAEVARLRTENDMLRASTDAAVDGVRAMLPAALKVARETEREACAAACVRAAEGEAARAEGDLRDGDTRHAEIFSGRAKALLQMAQALRAETEPTR